MEQKCQSDEAEEESDGEDDTRMAGDEGAHWKS